MAEPDYTWVIVGTTIGFFALAAVLLVPIYRFLNREEKESEAWTKEKLEETTKNREGGS